MATDDGIDEQYDKEGLDTLKVIADTHRFNNWMYQAIKPFLKGNILEIGSGIGNITNHVVKDKFSVTASDLRKNYCALLKERFAGNQYLTEVRVIDIVHPEFETEYSDLMGKFDCIFALNIVEHVFEDKAALVNFSKLLRQNGNLIILVPAYHALYNRFDKELKHYRRYTKSRLENLFSAAGLTISGSRYFNFMGIFGWWFSGKILNKKTIPKSQMKLFDRLVPIFKVVDKIVKTKIGLSVITFGKKSN